MTLSIITINYNNSDGLDKTLQSIESQTICDFEHIIIDGDSTDCSVEIIKNYAGRPKKYFINWISEKDKGIYNAMNKGIVMAKGEYCQFLNSGDILADNMVVERMTKLLQENIDILVGNMYKIMPNGKILNNAKAQKQTDEPTMLQFFLSTINHSPADRKSSLFKKFGLYDEELKICSDWKWYLQTVVYGKCLPPGEVKL